MSITNIKSFGIIINTLNDSPNNNALITNINALLDNNYKYCSILFYNILQKTSVLPKFCRLQYQSVWDFDGILISTDILTTNILKNCICAKRKLFYVYSFEWTSLLNVQYAELATIYQNPEIELIAKNEQDFNILKKIWKLPAGIVNNYNYKELQTIIDTIY